MWGAIIAAGISAASAIAGGISQANARRRMDRRIDELDQQEQNMYDRRYNERATERADAQRILTLTEERIKQRNKAAAGRSAVMGGTNEAAAVEKEANNKMYADVVSQINAQGEARKDNLDSAHMKARSAFVEAKNNSDLAKAQAVSQAMQGIGSAAGGIMGALDDYSGDFLKKPATTPPSTT